MKLQEVKSVDYDIDDDWIDHAVMRIIDEMESYIHTKSKQWYVLNESTGDYVLDEELMNEGIKEILQKGAAKVSAVAKKAGVAGQKAYDAIMGKVLITMNKDMPEVAGKLKAFAGKHKMATAIIAVVGASLMAMEPAAAGQAMDAIAQQDVNSVADMAMQGADIDAPNVTGGGGEDFAAQSNQGDIATKMLNHVKDRMGGEKHQFTVNGKTLNFDQAVQMAEQGTGIKAEEFMKFMAQKNLNADEVQNQFTKWLGQGIKKAMGMSS